MKPDCGSILLQYAPSAKGVNVQAKTMSQDWMGSGEKVVVGGKLTELYKSVVSKLSRMHICRRWSFIGQGRSKTTKTWKVLQAGRCEHKHQTFKTSHKE